MKRKTPARRQRDHQVASVPARIFELWKGKNGKTFNHGKEAGALVAKAPVIGAPDGIGATKSASIGPFSRSAPADETRETDSIPAWNLLIALPHDAKNPAAQGRVAGLAQSGDCDVGLFIFGSWRGLSLGVGVVSGDEPGRCAGFWLDGQGFGDGGQA